MFLRIAVFITGIFLASFPALQAASEPPDDRATVGTEQTRETLEQCRLARAVRTDEAQDLAAPDRERRAVEGPRLAEPLRQLANLEHATPMCEVSSGRSSARPRERED